MKPEQRWEVRTNRHPNIDRTCWGWIEGHPNHQCWSNSPADRGKYPTEAEARQIAREHNASLEREVR